MARRQARRVDSEVVQGEGSFVALRSLPWGMMQEARRIGKAEDSDELISAWTQEMLAQLVEDWDWVDDDGQPLPLPRHDAAVINRLTLAEIRWLVAQAGGDQGAGKN